MELGSLRSAYRDSTLGGHARAFFAHEYAHSFLAWCLGWKANPLALNYAKPTLTVFLIQLGIDQNVDELPIFANGHGVQAAMISAAGAVLGNALLTYSLSRWGYRAARRLCLAVGPCSPIGRV